VARPDPVSAYQKAFGAAVRAEREELGHSQERLGFDAELDRSYVSDIERGVRNPTLGVILRLARALGVRPGDLVTRADAATRRR